MSNAKETARFKEINKAFLSPHSKIVLIASHRGIHHEFPENSMAAFKKAIELGIDIIEIDVRHTQDDSLVIMHDATVDRMTNGKGRVDEFTFSALRKLRLTFNGQVTEEKIPTLEEVLTLAKGKILVDLDIKTNCLPRVMQLVQQTQTENTCFFFLSKDFHDKMLKEKNPELRTLVRTRSEADVDALFSVTKTEAVHIDEKHNIEAVTNKIRNNGARVWINALGEVDKKAAAGDLEAYGELIKNGANMIQTDYPALLLKYLKSKGLYYN
ncbi:MAG: glycerophosphodiester phosphodiesterase family protein [Niastella sp.]|uniref:glycerophosphodiester phosphodiesterase family protein n=1 Tax=Niastella sp. TaxID=1869183 RepID=UPI00389ABDFE